MLHPRVSAQTLGFVRVAVFGMWLLHIVVYPVSDLKSIPFDLLVFPLCLEVLRDTLLQVISNEPFLLTLKWTLALCLGALVVGARPYRPLAVGTCILLTLNEGLARGFGYIGHAELLLLYAAYVLAIFPAADGLTLRRPVDDERAAPQYRAALVALALTFSLPYTLIGARRLCAGGLDIFLDGSILGDVFIRSVEHGRDGGLGLAVVNSPSLSLLLQLGFPIVTVFELLSPLALFHRLYRRAWIITILGFHIGTELLMQISFRGNIVLLLIFFTDIEHLVNEVLPRFLPRALRRRMFPRGADKHRLQKGADRSYPDPRES